MSAAPDLAEHVIGYRAWRLRRDGRLVSAAAPSTWTAGVNDARCDFADHGAPEGGCTCGLYAFHDPPPAPSPGIVGAIKAHGQLESHHAGFRAEHAQIVALVHRHARPSRRELRAAARYEVPLVDLGDLAAAASQYGRPLAAGQRPARSSGELTRQFPILGRAHEQLARVYAHIVAPFRRHPWARVILLRVIAFAPLMMALTCGCLAALTMREVSVRGDWDRAPVSAWTWVTVAALLMGVLQRTPEKLGSGWLGPTPAMVRTPAVLGFGIALQFSDRVGIDGLAVQALKWAVGLIAVAAIAGALAARCGRALCDASYVSPPRPSRLAAAFAWSSALLLMPLVLLSQRDHAPLLLVCVIALLTCIPGAVPARRRDVGRRRPGRPVRDLAPAEPAAKRNQGTAPAP